MSGFQEARAKNKEELANFLGPSNMIRYEEFLATLQSRAEINSVRNELAHGTEPLREEQIEPMMAVVNAELQRLDQEVHGSWNQFYIKMVDDRVTVKLNGKLVIDNVVLENFWNRQQPVASSGPIELQSFTGKVSYRNIYLRELEPTAYAGGDASPKKANLEESTVARRSYSPTQNWIEIRCTDGCLAADRSKPNHVATVTRRTRGVAQDGTTRCAIRGIAGSSAIFRRHSAHEPSSAWSANNPSKRIGLDR